MAGLSLQKKNHHIDKPCNFNSAPLLSLQSSWKICFRHVTSRCHLSQSFSGRSAFLGWNHGWITSDFEAVPLLFKRGDLRTARQNPPDPPQAWNPFSRWQTAVQPQGCAYLCQRKSFSEKISLVTLKLCQPPWNTGYITVYYYSYYSRNSRSIIKHFLNF